MHLRETAQQIEVLLVRSTVPSLESAQVLLRELNAALLSAHPRERQEIQKELAGRAVLWSRLLERARAFIQSWSCAGVLLPESYMAGGVLRPGYATGRFRVDG